MNTPRTSPIAAWHALHTRDWNTLEAMSVPARLPTTVTGAGRVRLADVSWQRRLGCKGPGAAAFLQGLGIAVPAGPNRWQTAEGVLCARLGMGEFLLEALHPAAQPRICAAAMQRTGGVYPVPRQDFAGLLAGPDVPLLLRQTCSFDFGRLTPVPDAGEVVMTLMAGVAVTLTVERAPSAPWPRYRLWCDPSFAPYLWDTLLPIALELGGGAVSDPDFSDGESVP